MTIMDAGVHVWRPQAPDRPWMPGRKAHLPDPLTYEKFSAMMKEAGVKQRVEQDIQLHQELILPLL
jgi:predicted TIM-barrel fold metal-dependent hydrolase